MMNPGKNGQKHSARRNVKVNLGAWRQGQQKAKGGTNSKGTPKSGFFKGGGKGNWRFYNHRTQQVTNAKKGPGKNARVFQGSPMRGKNAWLSFRGKDAKGPGAPSPTASAPGQPAQDQTPVDLRDDQYWYDYTAAEQERDMALAPLEAELQKLQVGGNALYNTKNALLDESLRQQAHGAQSSFGQSGLLWSGARDLANTQMQRQGLDAKNELRDTIGDRRIAALQNQIQDARGGQWQSQLEALMNAARMRHETQGY